MMKAPCGTGLQASISGGDRGTSRAKRKLERAVHDLTTKGDKNPGRLKIAEGEVARSTEALEQGDLALAQLSRDRDALAGALERRGAVEGVLAERRSMLEKARQAERLASERDAAQERYERFRQAVEVAEQVARLAATHPSPNPLPVIRSGVERLRALDQKARELRAALSGEVAVSFEVEAERSWRPLSRWGVALTIIGVLIAGARSRSISSGSCIRVPSRA